MADKRHCVRMLVDVTLLLVVGVPILIFYLLGAPFERGFYCDDTSIKYPYKDSTVSSLVMYFVGTLLTLAAMLVVEKLQPQSQKGATLLGRAVPPYLKALWSQFGVFLFACAVSQLLTDVAKYTIGRLRPHFLDICKPDWSQITCRDNNTALYVMPTCLTKDAHRLKESRLSFPSGHASFSAVTMVYLVLYLQARLQPTSTGHIRLLRPFLQFGCVLITFYTGLSRVSDYKHHWSDVLGGMALGTTVAYLVWKNVAPRPRGIDCDSFLAGKPSGVGNDDVSTAWMPLEENPSEVRLDMEGKPSSGNNDNANKATKVSPGRSGDRKKPAKVRNSPAHQKNDRYEKEHILDNTSESYKAKNASGYVPWREDKKRRDR